MWQNDLANNILEVRIYFVSIRDVRTVLTWAPVEVAVDTAIGLPGLSLGMVVHVRDGQPHPVVVVGHRHPRNHYRANAG